MPDVNPTMTALEFRFDEELSEAPGSISEFMQLKFPQDAGERIETEQDKAVVEMMILGT
jgi:hypothetical protein